MAGWGIEDRSGQKEEKKTEKAEEVEETLRRG